MARRYTPSTKHIDSVIEPVVVLSSKFKETQQERIPDYFWPKSGEWGIRGTKSSNIAIHSVLTAFPDLHKTYVDDEHYNSGHGHAYQKYGVDPSVGAVMLVRPDQRKCSQKPDEMYRQLT